jgi:hypothetical protein
MTVKMKSGDVCEMLKTPMVTGCDGCDGLIKQESYNCG